MFTSFITDTANRKLSHRVDFTLLGVNFQSGDNFRINVTPQAERLDNDFGLPGDIELAEGSEFDYTRFRISGGTAGRRMVSLFGNYGWGNYFSGTRRDISGNLTVRPRVGVRLNFNGQWNRIELPEGQVSTTVYRWEVGTQFSPWLSLNNNIQYDNQSRGIGWQSRLRWIMKPGNDIFFVYTHNWINDPAGIFTNDRSAVFTNDRRGGRPWPPAVRRDSQDRPPGKPAKSGGRSGTAAPTLCCVMFVLRWGWVARGSAWP